MFIKLSKGEQQIARSISKARYNYCREMGIVDKQIGKQSKEFIDLEGIAGEIAVAKALNVYPDFEVNHTPEADLITPSGLAIDVKTTRYKSGRLIAAPWKTPVGVDWYVLVIGELPNYRIAGAMKSNELLTPKRLKDLGHGKQFTAEQSELDQFHEVFLVAST